MPLFVIYFEFTFKLTETNFSEMIKPQTEICKFTHTMVYTPHAICWTRLYRMALSFFNFCCFIFKTKIRNYPNKMSIYVRSLFWVAQLHFTGISNIWSALHQHVVSIGLRFWKMENSCFLFFVKRLCPELNESLNIPTIIIIK